MKEYADLVLLNGKIVDKLKKTDFVEKFKEIPKLEVFNQLNEHYFLVDCEPLKEKLIKSDKALTFRFSNGNGFKIYNAFVYYFDDELLMSLATDSIANAVQRINKKVKVETAEVQRATIEELEGFI